ncbi:MAG: hypothetical protein QNJ40_15380 [Xanthomonadales bacterium]|nr:hypothetical protein [Xanthomonadales bacterium]
MADLLHVTNGECANENLRAGGIPGDMLSWDDVLHEGPVPAGLDLAELSRVRADFIAGRGWREHEAARQEFAERNRRLHEGARSGEVILWCTFELYDQLHLLQLLDWFHQSPVNPPSIVWVNNYMSHVAPSKLSDLLEGRRQASPQQLRHGAELWRVFRSADPTEFGQWAGVGIDNLPFMGTGLLRLAQEYPAHDTGLTRTQAQILQVLADAPQKPGPLFQASSAMEQQAFMGDWSFWCQVEALSAVSEPALLGTDGRAFERPPADGPSPDWARREIELTDFGRAVQAGDTDFLQANVRECWIGGVQLSPKNDWRWNREQRRFQIGPGP